ncbi:MAG: hypothetical protein OIF32_02080 [Campylobacterales bacterium]|nr:hypothetical protein [Campylobacterales bacterium]
MSLQETIKEFNNMYKLPVNEKPTLIDKERLINFKSILMEEVHEIDEIIENYGKESELETLVALSDLLGDLIVYIRSESAKHGLPIDKVLKVIMDSNFSKLGEDGKPIYDERGKVQKGPNYYKPEPKIKELLEKLN